MTLTDYTPTGDAIETASGRKDGPDDPDPAAFLTFTSSGGDVRVSVFGGTILVLQGASLSDMDPDDFTLDGAALVAGINTNLGAATAMA